jgi:ergothioneine biosynthesis protein EgtB
MTELTEFYNKVRSNSEKICQPLNPEDYVVQIASFASPAKWHLAHISWFFETFLLKPHLPGYTEFDEKFNFLFNSYYNNVGERIMRTDRGNLTRPTIDKVYQYRAHIDENMLKLLNSNSGEKLKELVILGLNHEQQHQELLLMDLKYMFGHNATFPVYKDGFNLVNTENEDTGFLSIKEGVYEIGYQGNDFHFDNELGVHKSYIHDFEITKALVTNQEFVEFIENGGYEDFNLWLDEGWSWVQKEQIKAPLYWHSIDGVWHYYTLSGLQKVNSKAILCHISLYEAAAFAQWKGMRLPTEFEWEVASPQLKWGARWEWTNSAYLPYPNFQKAPGAVGEYNGKFMMSQMVLRGASVATPKNHSRNTYRNFFHPSDRWQFNGIRLVK